MDYFEYKGVKYGVGTTAKLKTLWGGVYETIFIGGKRQFYSPCSSNSIFPKEDYIIEIVKPVYYEEAKTTSQPKDNRVRPFKGDVQIGWIWYIIIMVVGSIFNDRLLIWIGATAYFFLWKNGYLNGDKK